MLWIGGNVYLTPIQPEVVVGLWITLTGWAYVRVPRETEKGFILLSALISGLRVIFIFAGA
ncbi:hypothetical protein ABTM58_19540, partial [Acinetobacter baumannii]